MSLKWLLKKAEKKKNTASTPFLSPSANPQTSPAVAGVFFSLPLFLTH